MQRLAFFALVALALGCGAGQPSSNATPAAAGSPPPTAGTVEARSGTAYDLGRDEALGGHTLARHVGRTAAELADRLRQERSLHAASSFFDRATAEMAVAAALAAERDRVARWCERGPRRANLAFTVRTPSGRPVGWTLRRGARKPEESFAARVVLRSRGDGYFVLTAYPTEER